MKPTILTALCMLMVFSAQAFGAAEKQIPLSATVDRSRVKVGERILLAVRGGTQPYAHTLTIDDIQDYISVVTVTRKSDHEFDLAAKKAASGTVEVRDNRGTKASVRERTQ